MVQSSKESLVSPLPFSDSVFVIHVQVYIAFCVHSAKNPDEAELDEALQNVVSYDTCIYSVCRGGHQLNW